MRRASVREVINAAPRGSAGARVTTGRRAAGREGQGRTWPRIRIWSPEAPVERQGRGGGWSGVGTRIFEDGGL